MVDSGPTGGYTGTVAWATYQSNVFAWDYAQDYDLFEFLTFTAHDAYGTIAGAYRTRGVLAAYLDGTTPLAAVAAGTAAVSLVLTSFTGRTHTMLAHLIQLSPAVSVQAGPNTLTVGFAADGAVAWG